MGRGWADRKAVSSPSLSNSDFGCGRARPASKVAGQFSQRKASQKTCPCRPPSVELVLGSQYTLPINPCCVFQSLNKSPRARYREVSSRRHISPDTPPFLAWAGGYSGQGPSNTVKSQIINFYTTRHKGMRSF